ncbi:NAD-dependent epimerase/dehydratase family protein [Amycolatopsis pigmentata]|uniref:NAD-dependent epimerase/dehydratase family protein n=1 Tax=Amycolatopsis pigmentata TaxID=450801 RepID=A0ABW5G3K9_9PSEU
MKTVVVTGAAGVLGGGLVKSLARNGMTVRGLDLRPAPEPVADVRQIEGDVRNPAVVRAAIAGADAVVHCAAALPSQHAEQIRSVIVDGTANVLACSREEKIPRVVHISSTAVYGLPSLVPTPEDYPQVPVDPYSTAKVMAEEACVSSRAQGMCVSVLRPKTFLGPGRMGLFSMLFEWAVEGRNFPVLGRGDVRIQMCALEDLIDAVRAVLAAPEEIANDVYNVAAAEFATLREDFQAVLDAAGHGKQVVSVPIGPALPILRGLQWARLSPVYGRLLSKLRADSYVSIEKARERLGFTPRFSNREAILRTFDWWRTQRGSVVRRGTTSREPWRQGALSLAKVLF